MVFLKSQSERITTSEGDSFSVKDYLRESSYFTEVLIVNSLSAMCPNVITLLYSRDNIHYLKEKRET